MYNFAKYKLYKMFGIFKKKSKKEKLLADYNNLKNRAFKMSRVNRKESDRLEYEASQLLLKIENIRE